jgi:hypothetical protein
MEKEKYRGVGLELTTSVVIGNDCIGSYKSNYHTIVATDIWVYIIA